jgi:hypothetical protein
MMRLIDADALPKYTGYALSADKVATAVENAPTIDAVPVVRCWECKWADWYSTKDGKRYCHCMETGIGGRTEDDYCSYAEREGGADNG